jgi:hypothetical protein
MPASSSSLEAPAVRRGDFSVWRRSHAMKEIVEHRYIGAMMARTGR